MLAEIVLLIVIGALLVDRAWDRHRTFKQIDSMSRAIIAKNVPEMAHGTDGHIKAMEVENDLAMKAVELQEKQEQSDRGPHYRVT